MPIMQATLQFMPAIRTDITGFIMLETITVLKCALLSVCGMVLTHNGL